jgi:hypothetical protein
MTLLMEAGRRLGNRRLARDSSGARSGVGAIDGAVFALLGLLVAFTFSGAASRFDQRRQLIVEEANNIGTAWLRLDLLPESAQGPVRNLFRAYVDARLTTYQLLPELDAAGAELDRSLELQQQIWKQVVDACKAPDTRNAAVLLLPALNATFDVVTKRSVALRTHPPAIIFELLVALALVSALLAGLGMAGGKDRSLVHFIGFPTVMTICLLVILDLEFPRRGFIRIDAVDQVLVDVRQSME